MTTTRPPRRQPPASQPPPPPPGARRRPPTPPRTVVVAVRKLFDAETPEYFLLLGTTLFLVVFGLVMVLSSSSIESRVEGGDFFAQAARQGLYALVGRSRDAARRARSDGVLEALGRHRGRHRRRAAAAGLPPRSRLRARPEPQLDQPGLVHGAAVRADQARARHLAGLGAVAQGRCAARVARGRGADPARSRS